MRQVRELVMEAAAGIEHIGPAQAAEKLAAGDAVIIDVREPIEWERHIEGAMQIPRGLIEFVADPECGPILPPSLKYDLTEGTQIITYCNTGARATLAARSLADMGYEDVANLEGGLTAWEEAGLPVADHHGAI